MNWLRTGSNSGLLWTVRDTSGFLKNQIVSWPDEELWPFQERPWTVELGCLTIRADHWKRLCSHSAFCIAQGLERFLVTASYTVNHSALTYLSLHVTLPSKWSHHSIYVRALPCCCFSQASYNSRFSVRELILIRPQQETTSTVYFACTFLCLGHIIK
jgi:hypothetical protein